nr:uncharacterized protein LOC127315242 [Lolium perenne]
MERAMEGALGRSTGKASSSRKPGPSWEIKMETTMKRMMQDFKREIMEELPERCAKDVVKLLNKSGVRYKPFAETLSDQYCYDEGCGSYLNGVPERKEFVYDRKSDTRSVSLPKEDVDKVSKEDNKEEDYITPARTKCDFLGDGTPDNPWQIAEDFKEASSSEVPSNIFEPALKNMNKEDEHKEGASEGSKSVNSATGKNEDLLRPAMMLKFRKTLLALTTEHIAAAEIFVQLCCKSEVIDAYIGDLSRRVGDDRYLCAAWRSSFLIEAHRKGHKIKNNNKNDDHLAVRTGSIQRVIDEYFRRDKAYFPVNISNNHWTTVIMHTPKQEFQVLDSLFPLSVTIDTVRALRQQISADIQEYNKSTSGFFPDVISWNIKSYDMPQQKDGNSCGLFVLQCMEHWDGDKWNKEISQEMINGSRNLINAQIVLATSNLLETVKTKVVRISKRFTK